MFHLPESASVVTALTGGPVKIFIAGGIGSGKSTVLAEARRVLADSGRTVLTAVPSTRERQADAALVIDDAHLLTDSELLRLTELATEPDTTVVIAAQPRDHAPQLRALTTAIERQRPRITLAPLVSGEISRMLHDPAGPPPSPGQVRHVMTASAGIPFLAAAVVGSTEVERRASYALIERRAWHALIERRASYALIERLRRLEQPELEALLLTSLSADLGAADLAAALDLPFDRAHGLVDEARATGLIEPSHSPQLRDMVHGAAAQLLGTARHHEVESALLRTQLEFSALSGELALQLARHGMRDARLVPPLRAHAAGAQLNPEQQSAIYRAAVAAGADDLRAPLADALARSGDCSGAAAVADDLLGSSDPAERAAGVRVGASVAAHDGNYGQAAELFAWLGPYPDAGVAAAAAIVQIGVGDTTAARKSLGANHAGPPTAAARSARCLAEGLVLTIDGPASEASARLGQAAAGELGVAMPDSVAALVTLAALHGGDSVRARSVIGRAVDAAGDRQFAGRHRLLRGWVRMLDGQLSAASADAAAADAASAEARPLHGRDALWSAALRTAIARRGGDQGGLQKHWYAGVDVLAEYAIDLYSLLPLGELWMAAARLGQQNRVRPALEQAFALLAGLGEPARDRGGWALPLQWAGVHAGIIANDPAAVAPHAKALALAAAHSPFAAALADAGRTWLHVLARQVDPAEVTGAARGLTLFGLNSDATRLAGQAALQATDPKVSAAMLQAARELKGTADGPAEAAGTPTPGRSRPVAPALSEREREVAELLLTGLTYRDIGAQLYISAKTVEHHVARIRRRLGAQSRSEMLSMLRAMLGGPG